MLPFDATTNFQCPPDVEASDRQGRTCLMIACSKGHARIAAYLIQLGADVNRKNVKGNTALHESAESGSLEVFQLLLASGAQMFVGSDGKTAVLAAAVLGHEHIVDYIVTQLDSVSRKEKIDALELLGATLVDRHRNLTGAMECWKRAMSLRYDQGSCPLPKPQVQSTIAAIHKTMELTTPEQLQEVVSDPDEMRMQSLLIRERVLGTAHPETFYFIRHLGAEHADKGDFERCIRLWMYALDTLQSSAGSSDELCPKTNSFLVSFTELFSFMMTRKDTPLPASFPDHLMGVLNRSAVEIRKGVSAMEAVEKDPTYFYRTLNVVVHLVYLLVKVPMTPAQDLALRKSLYQLVRLSPRGRNGQTLLHLASSAGTSAFSRFPVYSFPSTEVIELLLDVGADPNADDMVRQIKKLPSSLNHSFQQRFFFWKLLKGGKHGAAFIGPDQSVSSCCRPGPAQKRCSPG